MFELDEHLKRITSLECGFIEAACWMYQSFLDHLEYHQHDDSYTLRGHDGEELACVCVNWDEHKIDVRARLSQRFLGK